VSLQNSHDQALTSSLVAFGHGAQEAVTKVKQSHQGGFSCDTDCVLIRGRDTRALRLCHVRRQLVCKPGRQASQKPTLPVLHPGLLPPRNEKIKFSGLSHPFYDIVVWQPYPINTMHFLNPKTS
jgi:hypothetical protein